MVGDEYYAADERFADTLARLADGPSRYPTADRPAPDGWYRGEGDGWVYLQPAGADLPTQGWKIHVSGVPAEAAGTIDAVWEYCVGERVAFKFLRSAAVATIRNSKQAPRGSSGKLVTVYPADDRVLARTLTGLGEALAGRRGPYILSDLRCGDGPVYLRYGGFTEAWCVGPDDEWVPAVTAPDGTPVPDVRGPTLRIPPWAAVPPVVAAQLASAAETAREPFPYDVKEALHFSNAGGVYKAVEPSSGRVVVLREARPHAGLDGGGQDAVARLHRERDILRRLAGLSVVPRLIEHLTAWEHHFLVEEYVEGDTLHTSVGTRYPYIYPEPSPDAVAGYTDWALRTARRIEAALAALHERGVVHADLNPRNVLVRPDGEIVLVDFEQSFTLDEDVTPTIATPGFAAPWAREGVAIDEYGMNCLLLSMFLPMTPVLALAPAKAGQLVSAAAELFPLPDGTVARLRDGLRADTSSTVDGTGGFDAAAPDWDRATAGMVRAIRDSATPQRRDRLFPGDPAQFADGALNLATGAAGVLYALWAVGEDVEEYVPWLREALGRTRSARPGFYTGLHGVAYTLDRLGHRDDALAVLDRITDGVARPRGVGLFSGLSGTGLVETYFATRLGDRGLLDRAVAGAERIASVLDGSATDGLSTPKQAGLLRGWSGPAMQVLNLYEATGDPGYLDLARAMLDRDLARCERSPGGLEVAEGKRWLTYLDNGSAGIAVAVSRYLAHRPDDDLAGVPVAMRPPLTAGYVMFPGLLNGRAGVLAVLAWLDGTGGPDVTTHLRRLAWHAVPYEGGTAFPGDGLVRLSMDLGTGTAGVLLATHCAVHAPGAAAPLLGILSPTAVRRADDERRPEGGEQEWSSSRSRGQRRTGSVRFPAASPARSSSAAPS